MNPVSLINQPVAMLYDGDYIQAPEERFFDPLWWEQEGAVTGRAAGRGSAVFIEAPFGPAVLRTYLRGGWPARISRDRYLYTGLQRTRPFREFRLLTSMVDAGLPVPGPLAALCRRKGLTCTGALITRRLPDVTPLAELLGDAGLGDGEWSAIGRTIGRFHHAGVRHADLNARNILMRPGTGEVFLVDFDRSAISPGRPVNGNPNLARLRRSLGKLWPAEPERGIDPCWRALLDGYHG
ncbi:MAG: 3-deoxy-D-manno-octulosonic acid kinase [Xanthomonadales bacterium]|nr:3-deoxy-D-manno-octulosonic acid kinase [Xanthomonadales bacterium]NIX12095.1 3-deoxy-D-manno-octulosonic acid kinase [Xanthomonadales bacterium]